MSLITRPAVLLTAAVVALGLPSTEPPAGPAPGATSQPAGSWASLQKVREMELGDLGVSTVRGLSWSDRLGALVILDDAGGRTGLVAVTGDEFPVGRVTMPARASADQVAVDPATGSVTVLGDGSWWSVPATALRGGTTGAGPVDVPHGAASAEGMAYDARGRLVVLEDGSLVRPEATGPGRRTPVARDGHELRGLALHPQTGELLTLDVTAGRLLALDASGAVVAVHDASTLDLRDPQALAVGPSGDTTDDPSTLSVYIADAGLDGAPGTVLEARLEPVGLAANVVAGPSQVRTVVTSSYDPPSPDTAGIAYVPGADRLLISDSEVNEMSIFEGVNIFVADRPGVLRDTGVSQPWSNEPTGMGYDPVTNRAFVSDDDQKEVFVLVPGADGRFGTGDDTVSHFDTAGFGNTDPEGLDYDYATGSVWLVDGVNAEVFRVRPGADGSFGTSDDVRSQFDVGRYGARDPEGLAYDYVRDTIAVLDDGSEAIYELDRSGALLNTVDVSAANMTAAAGLAVAPSTTGSGTSYFAVARGRDNDSDPTENDGRLYEINVDLGAPAGSNRAPVVRAGPDQSTVLPDAASLDGTVTDDGLPDPPGAVTTSWSLASGPGPVTFGDPSAVDTTVTFSAAGTYVLRLTAGDGEATVVDDVTVQVAAVGADNVTEVRVRTGSDDAEQAVSGFTGLSSSDLELTTDGSTQQVVGVRFAGLQVPRDATVTTAWVQFRTDEASAGASAMVVRAEAADDTPTYQASSGNVTSRSTTSASVSWSPPDWQVVGESGAAQRTPDLAALVQAVVDRPGWVPGNALALQFSGTGRRTAEAYEGGASYAPLLHVEYAVDGSGGGGPVNVAPVVSAGADQGVVLPGSVSLDATVTDDGLPDPPGVVSTGWSVVSGPGPVTFADAAAVDTSASFSVAGSYVLRLVADDGELGGADEVTVVVQEPAGGGGSGGVETFEGRVAAGSDDAEQSMKSSLKTQLGSDDLEITTDGNTPQLIGVRFSGVAVPRGATVTNAYVQFRVDGVSTADTSLVVRAEAADDTPTYQASSGNVSSRATTAQSVAWVPAPWSTVGEEGPAQRTPDLAALVQAVVDRPGWVPGNALAFQIDGTGMRKAVAYEGGASYAPLLHVEYAVDGSGGDGPVNVAPVVSAGADQGVVLPGSVSLDATVTDDGLPDPPGVVSTVWSVVSGPGPVTFADAAAVDTSASFSVAGSYVLRLVADDGELGGADEVTVVVQEPAGGGGSGGVETFEGRVAAGSDDAEQSMKSSLKTQLGSDDLEITTDGNTPQLIGVRFSGVAVPRGATVTNAYVQFRVDGVSTADTSLVVRAEAADDTPTYQASSGNVSSRATTAQSVAWVPAPWSTVGEEGPAQRTPDLAALVQAVVDRPGWVPGNALAFQIDGTGMRKAVAYEGGASYAPLLHVEYILD